MNAELSREQIRELQSLLTSKQERLLQDIAQALADSDNEHYADMAGRVHDTGDQSVADLLSDINLITINHLVKETRVIDAAMQRIKNGSYGVCINCQKSIAFNRLKAEPAASRCITCQQSQEDTI